MATVGTAHRMLLAIHAAFTALQVPRLATGKLAGTVALENTALLVVLTILNALAGHLG
jgi:hypothetical protein